LKNEDELTKLSRSTDRTPIDKEVIIKSSVLHQEDSVEQGKIMKRPLRQESPTKLQSGSYNAERVSWSIREVEWCTAEKRLLFSAKDQDDAELWVEEIQKLLI
jgi:hypothetical protein